MQKQKYKPISSTGFNVMQKSKKITKLVFLGIIACLSYTSWATELTDIQIQKDLESNPLFILNGSSGKYQRTTTEYIEESTPQGAFDLDDFYSELETSYKPVLGKPKYIPIGVGDITTIIPIFDKPRYVGSPLVQSRYIRSQVRALLGRNLIDADSNEFANEAAQINTLYDNAFYYIQNHNSDVRYGDRLELDPTASGLAVDLVWPERRTINGEDVIVPIVYLTQSTYDARKITHHETVFNDDVYLERLSLDNFTIEFGRDAFLYVANELVNYRGNITGNGNLEIAVGGTLHNVSGLIHAEDDLRIVAQAINSQTIVHRYDFGNRWGGSFGEVAGINSTNGDIYLNAYSDILIQGGIVNAPSGAITFTAGGNIYITPVQYQEGTDYEYSRNWRSSSSRTQVLQSYLSAEDTIKLIAEGEIKIDAAEIVSDQGHIELLAKLGITIEDELEHSQYSYFRKTSDTTTQIESYRTVAMRALLDAGKGIRLHTEFGDITLKAVGISSVEGATVNASNGSVNLLLTTETDHYSYSSVTEGLFTTKTVNRGRNIETAVPNTIVGGFAVEALYGVQVEYEGDSDLSLDEQIAELSRMPGMEWMAEVKSQTPDVDWVAIEHQYETWNKSSTSLSPAFAAVVAIAVSILTQDYTGQLAAAITGASQGVTYAAMQAGFSTLFSQGAVAIGNGAVNGDIAGAMKDFASEETLKSLAVSMVTAGALAKVDAQFFSPTEGEINGILDPLVEAGATDWQLATALESIQQLSLSEQVLQAVTHATVSSGISTIASGGDFSEFRDAFTSSVAQWSVNTLGKTVATEIGEAAKLPDGQGIGLFTQYISHAALGCINGYLSSSISGGEKEVGCASGAGGAVVGEFVAQSQVDDVKSKLDQFVLDNLDPNTPSLTEQQFINRANELMAWGVDISKLTAGFVAFIAGGDVDIASNAGFIAAKYNGLALNIEELWVNQTRYYRWIDENGVVHLEQTPPGGKTGETVGDGRPQKSIERLVYEARQLTLEIDCGFKFIQAACDQLNTSWTTPDFDDGIENPENYFAEGTPAQLMFRQQLQELSEKGAVIGDVVCDVSIGCSAYASYVGVTPSGEQLEVWERAIILVPGAGMVIRNIGNAGEYTFKYTDDFIDQGIGATEELSKKKRYSVYNQAEHADVCQAAVCARALVDLDPDAYRAYGIDGIREMTQAEEILKVAGYNAQDVSSGAIRFDLPKVQKLFQANGLSLSSNSISGKFDDLPAGSYGIVYRDANGYPEHIDYGRVLDNGKSFVYDPANEAVRDIDSFVNTRNISVYKITKVDN